MTVRVTPKLRARVRRLYESNPDCTAIAKRTGLSYMQVYRNTRDISVVAEPKWTEVLLLAQIGILIASLGRRPSYAEIGGALGISRQRAHAVVHGFPSVVRALDAQRRADAKASRDQQILAMAADGISSPDIADALGCSLATVGRVLLSGAS